MKLLTLMLSLLTVVSFNVTSFSSERYQLTAADASASDSLGIFGDVGGNFAILGAIKEPGVAGSAYLFDLSSGLQQHQLVANDPTHDTFFGFSATVNSSAALVGAPGDPSLGAPLAGAVYRFDSATGNQLQKMAASDTTVGDEFGFSLDSRGPTVVVGAPAGGVGIGASYLIDTATGVELHKLTPSNGVAGFDFGFSVGIDGSTAIVGAPRNQDTLGLVPGSAYLFDVTTGNQTQELIPNGSSNGDEFGFSSAVDGALAIVGAPDRGFGLGSAFIFDVVSGAQLRELHPPSSFAGDDFGYAVDIRGNFAIVGAPGENPVDNAVYLYNANTGDFLRELKRSSGSSFDEHGITAALGDHVVLTGSPLQNLTAGADAGSGFLFCTQLGDFNCDGLLSTLDIDALSAEVRAGTHGDQFDLDENGFVEDEDRRIWVEDIKRTVFGDANLNIKVDFPDFVGLTNNFGQARGWAKGDFDGNGFVQFSDFVTLANNFGLPAVSTAAVPEPGTCGLLCSAAAWLLISSRRQRRS